MPNSIHRWSDVASTAQYSQDDVIGYFMTSEKYPRGDRAYSPIDSTTIIHNRREPVVLPTVLLFDESHPGSVFTIVGKNTIGYPPSQIDLIYHKGRRTFKVYTIGETFAPRAPL